MTGSRRGRWLLVCGAVVLGLFLWHDNVRPWRLIQAENARRQAQEIERQLEAEAARLESALAPLTKEVERQRQLWRDQRQEVKSLRREQRALEQKRYKALARAGGGLRDGRRRDGQRQDGEEARRARLEDRREVESLTVLIEDRRSKIESLRADLEVAEADLASARRPLTDLEAAQAELRGPRWLWWGPLTPFSPQIFIREARPSAVSHGPAPQPVDRCMTCHLGATRPQRGASWPTVLRSHPRLDLFVGATSPHPYAQFGCTVCHGGDGRATDFRRADHDTAGDDAERTMLPLPLLGAACQGCHGDALPAASVPEASPEAAERAAVVSVEVQAEGQRLLYELGCRNCHAATSLGRPAPALTGLAGKTHRGWLYDRLLAAPTGHPVLSRVGQTEDVEHLQTEALAVLARLWEEGDAPWPQATVGDATRGAVLFGSLGCRACHGARSTVEPGVTHGPPLGAAAHKLSPDWLLAWLLDPQNVQPGTTMPSLRLSSGEASDLVAFLTASDVAAPDTELPTLDGDLRDRLLFDHLSRDLSLQTTQAQIDAMTPQQRTARLGEAILVERGCVGCHRTPEPRWPELSRPVAVPLVDLGSRSSARLAASHVPQLAVALSSALGEPTSPPSPGSSQPSGPRYELTEEQASALLAAVLRPPVTPAVAAKHLPPAAVAKGAALVQRLGCGACHRIDGRGRDISAVFGEQQAPPSLEGIGKRLQAQWLEGYLAHPEDTTVRPWLLARMPSYRLTAQQRLDLVDYFLALDGVSAVHTSAPPSSRQDRVVGSMVFEILQCDRCHAGVDDSGGIEILRLAPSYHRAKSRLRPQWVVQWLLEPQRFRPSTSMPSYFGDGGEQGLAYLSGTLESPLFSQQEQRLLRAFDSETAMQAYLLDRRRVASALRDYVWSLGEPSNVR